MVTRLLVLLGIILFIEQNIPPALSRLSYSLIGILITLKTNIYLLSLVVIWSSSLNSILTWIVFMPLKERIHRYQQRHNYQDRISYITKRTNKFLTKKKNINKFNTRLQNYTLTRTWKAMLFVCCILIWASAIPDVFIIWVTRKKLNFFYYAIAAILAKCIAYLPIILLGKSLLSLISK